MLKRIINGVAARWQRRYYFMSRLFGARVPVHNLSWVPDGFAVQPLGATGIRLVDNFCQPEEAALLIDTARSLLERTQGADVLVNDVSVSGQLCLNGQDGDDPAVLPLLYRCAIVFGVPYTHVERISIGRVTQSSAADAMSHSAPTLYSGTRHSALLFLNEVPGGAGGETLFEGMRLSISPRVGRAVCWTTSEHVTAAELGLKEALPLTPETEKWFVQVWLRDHALGQDVHGSVNPPQARQGQPLLGDEPAPDGVWAPQDVDLEAVFGQPDQIKGLL